MEKTSKKITLATVKSFMKKNEGGIYINHLSSFDGMVDCVTPNEDPRFVLAGKTKDEDNSLGIGGAWFVKQSRDYISAFENEEYKGFSVSNCCGHFILAIKK